MSRGCPFCDIEMMEKACIFPNPDWWGKGEWKKQGNVFVVNNFRPVTEGHCMVIPRRHVEYLSELSSIEVQELVVTIEMTMERLEVAYGYQEFTPFWSLGKYRTDPHFHFQIVPGMIIPPRSSEEKEAAKLTPQGMTAMVGKLRNIFQD